MLIRIVIAAVLVGHAAIHLGFAAPRPPRAPGAPAWPFDVGRGLIVERLGLASRPAHATAAALVLGVLGAFALGAFLLLIGLVEPAGVAVGVGSALSLALLVGFGARSLALGVAIDAVALWSVLAGPWAAALAAVP